MSDPRKSAGKWHSLGTSLTLIFVGILSGEQGIGGVAGWIEEQRWRLGRQFKLKNCRVPSYGTVRRVLAGVNVEELEQRLGQWAQAVVAAYAGEDWSGIAIDGKRLRGSAEDEHPALHLLSAFSHELGIVLSQRAVGSKTNEIPQARHLVETLTLTGKLVTVDALHTQRETAQAIVEKKGPV